MKGVADVVVDTTARAVIRMKPDANAPELKAVQKVLGKRRKVDSIEKTQFVKAHEVYSIKVKGLG